MLYPCERCDGFAPRGPPHPSPRRSPSKFGLWQRMWSYATPSKVTLVAGGRRLLHPGLVWQRVIGDAGSATGIGGPPAREPVPVQGLTCHPPSRAAGPSWSSVKIFQGSVVLAIVWGPGTSTTPSPEGTGAFSGGLGPPVPPSGWTPPDRQVPPVLAAVTQESGAQVEPAPPKVLQGRGARAPRPSRRRSRTERRREEGQRLPARKPRPVDVAGAREREDDGPREEHAEPRPAGPRGSRRQAEGGRLQQTGPEREREPAAAAEEGVVGGHEKPDVLAPRGSVVAEVDSPVDARAGGPLRPARAPTEGAELEPIVSRALRKEAPRPGVRDVSSQPQVRSTPGEGQSTSAAFRLRVIAPPPPPSGG